MILTTSFFLEAGIASAYLALKLFAIALEDFSEAVDFII